MQTLSQPQAKRSQYRIMERDISRETGEPVCGIEDCGQISAYTVQSLTIENSGAMSPGTTSNVCANHAVEWLRWSIC